MRKAQLLLASSWLLFGSLMAEAQKAKPSKAQNNVTAIEREIREFYDSYAEDLRHHRREAIADRYDRRGVFFLGNGRKILESFESIKNSYQTKWTGPKSFEWKDLSVEVLTPDAAVVIARFEWQRETGQILPFSYTGLLTKRSGKWRIRVEDESTQTPKPN